MLWAGTLVRVARDSECSTLAGAGGSVGNGGEVVSTQETSWELGTWKGV